MHTRQYKRFLISVLIFVLVFSTGMTTSYFTPEAAHSIDDDAPQLASLHGQFDLFSSAATTVIVEMDALSVLEASLQGESQSVAALDELRAAMLEQLNKRTSSVEVKHLYNYSIAGFALELPSNRIQHLLTLPGVRAVHRDMAYTILNDHEDVLKGHEMQSLRNTSVSYIGAERVHEQLGYTGEGIRIAVLDTGVDYTHPDLEHAFDEEYRGWDLISNSDQARETGLGNRSGDPTYHGTHAAGLIAGQGKMTGVAPNSTLLSYRVLGPSSRGTTSHILAGLERAVQNDVHVIYLAAQHAASYADHALNNALETITDAGVVVVTPAGNHGPGYVSLGLPGLPEKVISVGATHLPSHIYDLHLNVGQGERLRSASVLGYSSLSALLELNDSTLQVVPERQLADSFDEEFYKKVSAAGLEGNLKMILRDRNTPVIQKVQQLKEEGAVGVLLVNDEDRRMNEKIAELPLPVIQLSHADGRKILSGMLNEQQVNIQLDLYKEVGETIATFSSRGGDPETNLVRPDLLAPGVRITSTYLEEDYVALSGTGVAAAHVAGAAALLLEANPEWSVEQVKAALMNSATRLSTTRDREYAHAAQGAGSINVYEALQLQTLVEPASLFIGSVHTGHSEYEGQSQLSIRNISTEEQELTIEYAFALQDEPVQMIFSKANLDEAGPEAGDDAKSEDAQDTADDSAVANSLGNETEQEFVFTVGPQETEVLHVANMIDASHLREGYYEGTVRVHSMNESIVIPLRFVVTQALPHMPSHFQVSRVMQEGMYLFNMHLQSGADALQFMLFDEEHNFVEEVGNYTSISPGRHFYSWGGPPKSTSETSERYYLFAYVQKNGMGELLYGTRIME